MTAAATQTPNLSAADVLQSDPSAAGGNLANQGQGSSYLSMLPAILQSVYSSGNSGVSSDMANSAPYKWLVANNYLTDDGNGGNVGMGWKAAGVGQGGTYDPTVATNIGQGFGSGNSNQLQMVGNNPYGVSTLGSLDVHELQSPTQNPSMYGSTALGPTVSRANLASNQDAWSKYIVPLMQAGASIGFGGLGGMGQLTGLQSGIFNTLGNMATGTTNTAGGLAGIGGSVLGASLTNGLGLGNISPYINAAMQGYKISQNPSNPASYLGTLGQLAKLGAGS